MKIACIIPAYNEAKTIENVINCAKKVSYIDQIVVVNDGSNDNTGIICKNAGVKVLEHTTNLGKGAALKTGIECTKADIFIFLDADLIGLTPQHIINLLRPVINDEADMCVGIFSSGRFLTDLAQVIAPDLSGQRAIRANLLNKIDYFDVARYGVEIVINKLAARENWRVKNVELKDMSHVMKEEKLGFKNGIAARFQMYRDILRSFRM